MTVLVDEKRRNGDVFIPTFDQNSDNMLAFVELTAKDDESRQKILMSGPGLVNATRSEEGCWGFDMGTAPDSKKIIIFAVFNNQKGLEAHHQNPYVTDNFPMMMTLLVENGMSMTECKRIA